eukprot:3816016-Prymnesium_polylepis.1
MPPLVPPYAPPTRPPMPPPADPPSYPPPPFTPFCVTDMDLYLVLDESGGMAEYRDEVVAFAVDITNAFQLSATSAQVAAIAFSDSARILSDLTYERTAFDAALTSYDPSGDSRGISLGLQEALSLSTGPTSRPDANQVVLLLTDGSQSTSLGGDREAISVATSLKTAGVTIIAAGLGLYCDTLSDIMSSCSEPLPWHSTIDRTDPGCPVLVLTQG